MRKLLPLLVLMSLATSSVAQRASEQFGKQPPPVTITIDVISVSRSDAFSLVRLNSTAMWKKVCEMVKAGTATSEYLGSVTTVPDERAIVECISEIRHLTDIDHWGCFGPELAEAVIFAPPPVSIQARIREMAARLAGKQFETRNTGFTMEVLPAIRSDGIYLELIPSGTALKGFRTFPAEPTLRSIPQPFFEVSKVQTKVLVQSGKPQLLGAGDFQISREGERAKVAFVFVTATVHPDK